jgi:hypothetical protein
MDKIKNAITKTKNSPKKYKNSTTFPLKKYKKDPKNDNLVIKHVINNFFLFTQLTTKEFIKIGSNNATIAHFYFKRLQVTFFD